MSIVGKIAHRLRWSEPVYRLRQLRFNTPNFASRTVDLTPTAAEWLTALRRDGLVRIDDPRFRDLAAQIQEQMLAPLERGETPPHVHGREELQKLDRQIQATLSFADPLLMPLHRNRDLLGMLYNYYGRQPYFRNPSLLIKSEVTQELGWFEQGKYHLDGGLRQVSFMLLLNDLSEGDTHMEYAKASHNGLKWAADIRNRYRYDDETYVEGRFEKIHLTGPAGTLYVFDAGNGFHRAVYYHGTTRTIVHSNITTGADVRNKPLDARADLPPFADDDPGYVRAAFDRVVS